MVAFGVMTGGEAPELARLRADHDRAEAIYGALKLDFRLRRGAARTGYDYAQALIRHGQLDPGTHLLAAMAERARLYPGEGFAPLCVAHGIAELGLAWLDLALQGRAGHATLCRERAHLAAEHLADFIAALPGHPDLPPQLGRLGSALADAYEAAGEGERATAVMAAVLALPVPEIKAA